MQHSLISNGSIGVGRKFYSNPSRKLIRLHSIGTAHVHQYKRSSTTLVGPVFSNDAPCSRLFALFASTFHNLYGCSCWRLCSYVGDGTDCPPLSQHHCSGLLLSATSSSVNCKHVFSILGFISYNKPFET